MEHISNRLKLIADLVTTGNRIADIGSDHALLPIFLVSSGKVPSAIAGEINEGPWMAAKRGTAAAGLTAKIDVRMGNGLEVVTAGEVDTITISGMGGSLIRTILQEGKMHNKLDGVKELVLQPNVGEEFVRRWLLDEGWLLQDEQIIEEDGKIYEVLHAVRVPYAAAENEALYGEGPHQAIRLRMGPYLLKRQEAAFQRKWRLELDKLQRITKQLALSELPESREKEAEFQQEIRQIEEALQC